MKIVYGPVSSWRLGRSLGIDPLGGREKRCTYDCIYCQLGPTPHATLTADAWVRPSDLAKELRSAMHLGVDYATFSGVGEPTLAANLPELIRVAREMQPARLAILTNGSLMLDPRIRETLAELDFVIVKVDASREETFQAIHRPRISMTLETILHALREFRRDYQGMLAVETMLTSANIREVEALAELVREIDPDEAQLNTPLRPSPVAPLPPSVMAEAATAYFGLPICCVYQACRPETRPLEAASTSRRRPEARLSRKRPQRAAGSPGLRGDPDGQAATPTGQMV
jgi:wyosine [tRNA(Phe)-imidazoG37] synthetase (radical SAM superfamily)